MLTEHAREKVEECAKAWIERDKEPEGQIALHALQSLSEQQCFRHDKCYAKFTNKWKISKATKRKVGVNTGRVGVFAFGLP